MEFGDWSVENGSIKIGIGSTLHNSTLGAVVGRGRRSDRPRVPDSHDHT